MNDNNGYRELIRKYRNGSCTADELKRIRELIHTPEFLAALEQQWEAGIEQPFKTTELDRQRQFQQIMSGISMAKENNAIPTKTGKSLWSSIGFKVAACIAFCAFASLLYFLIQPKVGPGDSTALSDINSLVLPGKQTAQILFDDGTAVDLEKIVGDTTIVRPEFSVSKTRDGKITYHFHRGQNENRLVYNTIVTPKGGEYKLVLPDGTVVWLNAMTKLRYPVAFQSDTREVNLEGEAYFEVTKVTNLGKRVPFIVKTGEQSLEVLGTAFNISNYNQQVVTTLTEGKVKLIYAGNKVTEKFLVPNEQAKYDVRKATFTKDVVDPFYFMAWKNGNFAFDNASIYEVMGAISRWYDVDVHYHGDLDKVRFSGSISRYENIDKLLKTIALAGGVRFDRKERRVDVM
ncbi:FecR family protein [Sphingobacterium sp. HMA12]|uniref:FecR family protein n=1 Tax=Sphingobacterium sp. HMA12 TaxID=2050894 RepID=UPI000CEA396F|nr:FecR domain-containing protein [Sphingobacterium sp. HMA12]